MKKLLTLINYPILNLTQQIQKGLQNSSDYQIQYTKQIRYERDNYTITFSNPLEDGEPYVFETGFAKELTITQSHGFLSHYISYGYVAEIEEIISSMNRE